MLIAFVIALAMNGFAYWNSDQLVLRMHGAQEIGAGGAPELQAIVARLAKCAQLPMPRLYIMQGQAVDGLFSTHPSTENRIRRLHDLARSMGDAPIVNRRRPWG